MTAAAVEERAIELARHGSLNDEAINELVRMADGGRAPLEAAARRFVARLHRRSDDFEATNGLRLVNSALVRIGWESDCYPRLRPTAVASHEDAPIAAARTGRAGRRLRWRRARTRLAWS